MKTGNLRIVKAGLSGFMSAVLVLYTPVMALAGDYDIQYGDITITATDNNSHTVNYSDNAGAKTATDPSPTVYGTSPDYTVTLDATNGDVNVTFRDLTVDADTNHLAAAAVNVTGSNNVTIELENNNTLLGGPCHAGIEDHLTGTLTIKDANNDGGSLTAIGGIGAAGIGGKIDEDGNNITITGGNITALGGYSAAGIGGGYESNGSNIIISGSAQVSVAGGNSTDYSELSPFGTGAGAAIGNGGEDVSEDGNLSPNGAFVQPNTDGLYTTGSVTYYQPGTTAEAIAAGTANNGETVQGEVPPPVQEPDPINPGPAVPSQAVPEIAGTQPAVAGIAPNINSNAESTSVARLDTDAAFLAAVEMQIEELLNRIIALLAEGRVNEAQALILKGLTINAGTHRGFNAATLAMIGQASRAGIAITVNFSYAGNVYSFTIPGNSEIDLAALVEERGYCDFMKLVQFFG